MLPISGYTDQPDEKVNIVNYNKQLEEALLRLFDDLAIYTGNLNLNLTIDPRWLAIGRDHIEQGFMALNRAVFQPQRVKIATPINITADPA